MAKTKDQIIEQIRALMAKSVSQGCTVSEAEAAAAKVSALIAHWQIKQGELTPKEDVFTAERVKFKYNRHQNWSVTLASVIASITGTFFSYSERQATFHGRTADVELAAYYFAQLQERTVKLAWEEHRRVHGTNAGAIKKAWFTSFNAGFALGLRDRMMQARTAAAEGNRMALLVLDQRVVQAEEFAKRTQKFGKGRAVRFTTGGYEYGYAAGRSTDLYEGIQQGAQPAMLPE